MCVCVEEGSRRDANQCRVASVLFVRSCLVFINHLMRAAFTLCFLLPGQAFLFRTGYDDECTVRCIMGHARGGGREVRAKDQYMSLNGLVFKCFYLWLVGKGVGNVRAVPSLQLGSSQTHLEGNVDVTCCTEDRRGSPLVALPEGNGGGGGGLANGNPAPQASCPPRSPFAQCS